MDSKIIYIFIWVMLLYIISSISDLKKDIAHINANINKIAEKVEVPNTLDDELKKLILEGKKIEAVKNYRVATGAGLVEAKEYIDFLSERK